MSKVFSYLVLTENFPILDQLLLEEGFLRTKKGSLIWINLGSPKACILGISSKADEMIDLNQAHEKQIPIIRRYSGGGTVVVDHNTIFVSFIANCQDFSLEPFPQPIMNWSKQFYFSVFKSKAFDLKENDYVLGEKKFGGNAQYLAKNRFVHHSTLLWDYNKELMGLLKQPKKAPQYRKERSHGDFLTTLKDVFEKPQDFISSFIEILKEHFELKVIHAHELREQIVEPYRQSTHKIELTSFSHFDHLIQTDQKTLV